MVISSSTTDVSSSAIVSSVLNSSDSTTVAMPMISSSPQQLQPSGTDNAQEPTSTLTTDESSSTEVLPTSSAEMFLSPSTESPLSVVESSFESLNSFNGSGSTSMPVSIVISSTMTDVNPSVLVSSVLSSSDSTTVGIPVTSSSLQQLQSSGTDNAQEPTSILTTGESTSTEVLPTSSAEMLLSPSTENTSFNMESSGETPSEVPSSFQISATELDGSSTESISFTLPPVTTLSSTSSHSESLSPTPVVTPEVLSATPSRTETSNEVLATTPSTRIETSELTPSSSMALSNHVLYSSQLILSPTEPLASSLQQVVTSTHQENMTTPPSLIVSSSTQDLVLSSSPVDAVPQEAKFGEISRPLTGKQVNYCWLVRGSLFIELGYPGDLGKGWRGNLGTFMISRPI